MRWLMILLLLSLVALLVVGASLALHIWRKRRQLRLDRRAELALADLADDDLPDEPETKI